MYWNWEAFEAKLSTCASKIGKTKSLYVGNLILVYIMQGFIQILTRDGKILFSGMRDGETITTCGSTQGLGTYSSRFLGSPLSEIAFGAICEAKMHYAEVIALWYIALSRTSVAC